MFKGIVFLIAASFSIASHARVYTCEVDGKKVYQSVPCKDPDQGTSKRVDNTMQYQMTNNGTGSSYRAGSSGNFRDSSFAKFTTAKAVLESLEVDGRDCEWALKVDEREIAVCADFMSKMVDGGPFTQSMNTIMNIVENDPAFFEDNEHKFQATRRTAERVAEYAEFARVRLAGR